MYQLTVVMQVNLLMTYEILSLPRTLVKSRATKAKQPSFIIVDLTAGLPDEFDQNVQA